VVGLEWYPCCRLKHNNGDVMFIGSCIIVIVEE